MHSTCFDLIDTNWSPKYKDLTNIQSNRNAPKYITCCSLHAKRVCGPSTLFREFIYTESIITKTKTKCFCLLNGPLHAGLQHHQYHKVFSTKNLDINKPRRWELDTAWNVHCFSRTNEGKQIHKPSDCWFWVAGVLSKTFRLNKAMQKLHYGLPVTKYNMQNQMALISTAWRQCNTTTNNGQHNINDNQKNKNKQKPARKRDVCINDINIGKSRHQ
jgi:hypothetical protein